MLSVVLNECEMWYFVLREEHGLKIFENVVLKKIFGPEKEEVKEDVENYILKNFVICTHSLILLVLR